MLASLARHAQKKAITPGIFKKCLQSKHSQMLSWASSQPCGVFTSSAIESMRELDAFLRGNLLKWDALVDMGRELSRCCDPRLQGYLSEVGRLMTLGASINFEFGRVELAARPQFCRFCWRFKMTTSKYCSIHSPSGSPPRKDRGLADNHWSGRRLLPLFGEWQKQLECENRRRGLRAEWRVAVGERRVMRWIRMRRPRVYEQLVKEACEIDDVGVVISLLDLVPEESDREKSLRIDFHLLLKDDLSAVFTMICKAEAWMQATLERQNNWGGARKSTGRKPVDKVQI